MNRYSFVGSFAMLSNVVLSLLVCIAGCMRCGGVWFWYALLVMLPWFAGAFTVFGVAWMFTGERNRLSCIVIMMVGMAMVWGAICWVDSPMYVEASGFAFGWPSLRKDMAFYQANLLVTVIIVCYVAFTVIYSIHTIEWR